MKEVKNLYNVHFILNDVDNIEFTDTLDKCNNWINKQAYPKMFELLPIGITYKSKFINSKFTDL